MSDFRVFSPGDSPRSGLEAWVSGFGVGTEVVVAVVSEEVRQVEPGLRCEVWELLGRQVQGGLWHRMRLRVVWGTGSGLRWFRVEKEV